MRLDVGWSIVQPVYDKLISCKNFIECLIYILLDYYVNLRKFKNHILESIIFSLACVLWLA